MQFTVDREAFLKGLLLVQGAIDKRQAMPILSNILVTGTEQGIQLLATDLELELIAPITAAASSKEPLSMTIPGRKCLDITRTLPEGTTLTVEASEDKVMILAGRSRFSLATMAANEYPVFAHQAATVELSMTQTSLKQLLDHTSFAMAQQDVRYYLNGLMLAFSTKGIRAVATDGHRLATQESEGIADIAQELNIIVPRKAVLELSRLLQDGQEYVDLLVNAQSLGVVHRQFRFASKLIEGRYPDYQRLLVSGGTPVLMAREAFKQVLQRVAVLLNERSRGALFVFSEGTLCIRARNSDHDEMEEQVEIDYSGPTIEIGFNLSYLLEYLNILKCKTVRLYLSDSTTSVRMEAAEGSSGQYVVMPMRL